MKAHKNNLFEKSLYHHHSNNNGQDNYNIEDKDDIKKFIDENFTFEEA